MTDEEIEAVAKEIRDEMACGMKPTVADLSHRLGISIVELALLGAARHMELTGEPVTLVPVDKLPKYN